MGNPFTSTSVTSYNANPPPDDGSQVAGNIVAWSTIKTKLPDPIKTAFDTSETNTNTAFSKVIGGAGFTSTGTNYTILLADQGKFVKATASGITITTPDATVVNSPFVCVVLNNSTGTITVAGNNPGVQQNIDGVASLTLAAGAGLLINTDGTNWFTGGQQGVLLGKQLMYGDIINGTIVESNSSNAVTFALKTLAGADPSSTDPVLVCFRSPTSTTGNYIYRTIAAATSVKLTAGSKLGATDTVPFRAWIVLFDDAGTIKMGVINCLSGSNIFPLGKLPIASSTQEDGSGGADSAQVFYTDHSVSAVTSKAYLVFASASYESGLSTAGNWNVDPNLQLFKIGSALPGQVLQTQVNTTTTVGSVTNTSFTVLASTQSQAISLTSAANMVRIFAQGSVNMPAGGGTTYGLQVARSTTLIGNPIIMESGGSTAQSVPLSIIVYDIPGTTSSTTYQFYGKASTNTISYPTSGSGAVLELQEIVV